MWSVHIFRDNGYSTENFTKKFEEEDDAYDFFSDEVKGEFDSEIESGLVSDQEIQNIINNSIYTYSDEKYDVTISLELSEIDLNEDEDEDYD